MITTQSTPAPTGEIFCSKHGKIPKLTTSNYYICSILIESILETKQAWKIIMGEEQSPNAPAAGVGPVVRDCYEEKLGRYNTRHAKATTIILQSCTLTIQTSLTNCKNPYSM
jgi:hypothetical protein